MTGFISHTLGDLAASIDFRTADPLPPVWVTGIAHDSRQVQTGNIFVALVGGTSDGHRFIPAAIDRGAAAVVGSQALSGLAVPYLQVYDTRQALAQLSAAFYCYPGRQLTVLGVTGTDGKTTTSNLVYQILMAAGFPCGIISTVNATIGKDVVDTGFHVTTPEAPEVQRYLSRMVSAGLSHVVLEATSHGLAQHRVTSCEFDIGIVTNVTHEHLDYHGTYASYLEAKGRLIRSLAETAPKKSGNPRLAVLNRDDEASFASYSEIPGIHIASYSLQPVSTVWAEEVEYSASGLGFTAHGPGFSVPIRCRLLGEYNVSNCLAAITATVVGLGISPEVASQGIAQVAGVSGRMEVIDLGQDFATIVDFAHSPNALRRTLETARRMTAGKVIVVFGSAGLRDREKRRMMAEVSARLADLTILTAEDPRTESLDSILAEMARGAESQGGVEGSTFYRIADRAEAIRFAVRQAQPGDMVLSCGKGHEQSMCFGEQEYPWDDRTAMRAAVAERLGKEGSPMPYLPTQE
jgi:UDP-N-acetylmuramoyl-L-alanyl-D-glutamate--2,6-diaminopimelate ligase